jgi:hypothetical protein
MSRFCFGTAVALSAAMAASVFGQSIVVPNVNATMAGGLGEPVSSPFAGHIQTVIDPDQLPPGPINITGFTWRAAPGTGSLTVTVSGSIYLFTSPNWANSAGHPLMSTTFANNLGPENLLVMSPSNFVFTLPGCAAPGPCPFGNNFAFTTPFPYDQANGPLLINLHVAGSASGTGQIDHTNCTSTTCVTNQMSASPGNNKAADLDEGSYVLQITYTPLSPGPACSPAATTLCIDDQPGDKRFKLQASWATSQGGGQAGNGQAISLSSAGVTQGGLFWFFSASNPEMLVKVLGACGINGRHWVFASAGTNVGLVFTVTDTLTGAQKVYGNDDLQPAFPIQDLNAFACQ